jgi:hypothetical protein
MPAVRAVIRLLGLFALAKAAAVAEVATDRATQLRLVVLAA